MTSREVAKSVNRSSAFQLEMLDEDVSPASSASKGICITGVNVGRKVVRGTGSGVGSEVGSLVGATEGFDDGDVVGLFVGMGVGALVCATV